jgi:hypothetical protein
MGNLFDAILVLLLVAVTLICLKLGFIRLLKPFRKLAAFLLAWSFKDSAFIQGTVGKIIKTENFKAFLNERVDVLWGEKIENAVTAEGVTIAERFDEVFGFWGKLFANIKNFCISLYDQDFAASPDAPPSEQVEAFVKSVTEYIGNAASHFFTALFGFIFLYILFSIGLWLAAKILDNIFDEGFLGVVNKVIGGAVGVCYGFLLAWVLSIIFVLLFPLITTFDLATITGGYFNITEWFYSNFFISQLLGMTI